MNAALLLEHYERIADAPDAIAQLRRFILDLAVRGKLVEQDPNEEPASDLLKRVSAAQARLENTGKIRKREQLPPVDPQNMPYGLPINWQWVRFAQLANFYAGRTPARNDLSFWNTGEHAWVSIADMEDGGVITRTKETVSTAALKQVFKSEPEPAGTIIMSFKLTIGKIARLEVPAFHNEAIISIHPYLPALEGFLFMALPELARAGNTKGAIKGATLNRDSLSKILIPLPPLAEQHRIVSKFDELMALCGQLEATRAEREAGRHKLTLSTLAKLNEPDPETFADDARFALEHLEPLTKCTDQLKQLRQTILNLAVQGKLVEQDPSDEPAISLFEEIANSVHTGGRHGKRKTKASDAPVPSVNCPAGWHSAQLAELAVFENGDRSSNYPSGSDIKSEGIPFISTKAIIDYAVSLNAVDYISVDKFASLRSGKVRDLDILITLRGSVGKFGLFRESPKHKTGFINAQLLILRCLHTGLVPYIMTYMRSDGFTKQISNLSSGSATPQLSAGQLASVSVPLPPLAEQHRIVAKVDELMALCDQLEASLNKGEQACSKLLQAVLHEALEPA